MGKSQRDKGARNERDIVKALTAFFGVEFKRQLDQTREGGLDVTEADGIPFSFEIKARAEAPAVLKFLEQAAASRRKGTYPVAIVKGDRKPPVVVLYLYDFCEIALPLIEDIERQQGKRRAQ